MRHREDWKEASQDEMWGMLRGAMMRKPVDWAEISDVLWWARVMHGDRGDVMWGYIDYLRHHLCEHTESGGGWYAGERKEWMLGDITFPTRWIPAGRFLMGAGADDAAGRNREKPQREVTITRGFWIGETPVLQGKYKAIMGVNPSDYQGAGLNAPVEEVSWYDAAAFANKLSVMERLSACFAGTGEWMDGVGNGRSDYLECRGWRLPTEAEWEYAARAGTTTPRYGALDDIAWHNENSGETTHRVRQKQANAWGLYDMLGNVWEWCYDCYGEYTGMGKRDPLCTDGDPMRVVRGGAWSVGAGSARSAYRSSTTPALRDNSLGFRLVRSGF